jgi:hypothetical protein
MDRVAVQLPEGYTVGPTRGLGPFVSRQEVVTGDGTRLVWESRWHRKHPRGLIGNNAYTLAT